MRRFEYNIEMDYKEVGLNVVDWTALAEVSDQLQTVVHMFMNFGFIKCEGLLVEQSSQLISEEHVMAFFI